ncbi:MAG: FtsQ-type POTRA domain-containing protein, partial [Armatimonadota bacterium]
MSRFRDVRPHQSLPPKSPRKSTAKAYTPPKKDVLGPRPVSARQQSRREGGDTAPATQQQPTVPSPPPVVRPLHPAALPPLAPTVTSSGAAKRRKRLRDAETTRSRVKVRRAARNRRHINLPKLLLGWATALLVVECVAAALFSPRMWVKRIVVEGNRNVSHQTILSRLKLGDQENIVRLPVSRLRSAVGAEPEVETTEIRRDFLYNTVRVTVKERTPWACVQTADNLCYTIDPKLVPFRTADVPPVGLPLLKLSGDSGKVRLGKPMTAPGLPLVSRCLTWARGRTDFPLDAVTIDSKGKLCLNRAGGARFLLGSGQ